MNHAPFKPKVWPYWTVLAIAACFMAWLFVSHLVLFFVVAALGTLSGIYLSGLFSSNARNFYESFFLVAAVTLGGIFGGIISYLQRS